MPTGYTDEIQNGMTLGEFILKCARSRLCMMHIRDVAPHTEELVENYIPDVSYYDKKIAEAEVDLEDLLSETNIVSLYELNFEESIRLYEERYERNAKLVLKYKDMLFKVEQLKLPKEYEDLRAFMLDQIKISINDDCGLGPKPLPQPPTRWYEKQISFVKKQVAYHVAKKEKALRQAAEANIWAAGLNKIIRELESEDH
jgi:hypothetical protein